MSLAIALLKRRSTSWPSVSVHTVGVRDGVAVGVTVGLGVFVGRGVGVTVAVGVIEGVKLAVGCTINVGSGVSVGVTMTTTLVGSGANGSHATSENAAAMKTHSRVGKRRRDNIGDLGTSKCGML